MTLTILGGILLLGLVADLIGRSTFVPRVTLLLLAGLLVGKSGLNLIPPAFVDLWFPALTQFALAMVGFLLGQQLTTQKLRGRGQQAVLLALGKAVGAALAVALALVTLGMELPLALIFAGIATATAPTATFDVVQELNTHSPFSRLLLRIVAIDDAIGLILFALLLALATTLRGSTDASLAIALVELGGSLVLGLAIGIPMSYLTGRLSAGTPTQAEAFGFLLLCAGLADWWDVSPILSAMVAGSLVGTLARHHKRPFHAIEAIEWPFLIMFFVLTGASATLSADWALTGIVLTYIVARAAGTCAGVAATAAAVKMNASVGRWLGPALLPQAGVALGMALLAAQQIPEYQHVILSVVLLSTIILELTSPIITRVVLQRMEHMPLQQRPQARPP